MAARGIDQKALAAAIEIPEATLSRRLSGATAPFSRGDKIALARALDVPESTFDMDSDTAEAHISDAVGALITRGQSLLDHGYRFAVAS